MMWMLLPVGKGMGNRRARFGIGMEVEVVRLGEVSM